MQTPMSSTSDDHTQPDLPPELERAIFELACANNPCDSLRLLLVARRVNIWLEPFLYRVLCVASAKSTPPMYLGTPGSECVPVFKRSLNAGLLNRFGMHAQHLLFQRIPVHHILDILRCTPNASSIALWSIRGVLLGLLPVLTYLPNLAILSFDPSCFFMEYGEESPIPFDIPMFRNIEELEIVNVTPSWTKWRKLADMPLLKRLILFGRVDVELLDAILEGCHQLESLFVYDLDPHFRISTSHRARVSRLEIDRGLVEDWEWKARSSCLC